jgi:hypothetical protein
MKILDSYNNIYQLSTHQSTPRILENSLAHSISPFAFSPFFIADSTSGLTMGDINPIETRIAENTKYQTN